MKEAQRLQLTFPRSHPALVRITVLVNFMKKICCVGEEDDRGNRQKDNACNVLFDTLFSRLLYCSFEVELGIGVTGIFTNYLGHFEVDGEMKVVQELMR